MSGEDDKNVLVPSVPVVIQLDDSHVENVPTSSKVTISTVPTFTTPSLGIPAQPEGLSPKLQDKKHEQGSGLSPGKSLLGADLFLKPASLAMPPPSSTTVKKARSVSPGMSMVKWMKLQENRVRPPTRRKIPLAEIAKHNTESDCWMVIRNCVYDVTEYCPYHPGGVPELMKGAGKDATALFNEVHRWVNFDSILRSCLLGYFKVEVGESFEETDENTESKQLVALPDAKFSQTDTDLIFQVDSRCSDELSDDNWCVSILNRERLLLKVVLKPPELWMAHLRLLENLKDDTISIKFQNSFKRAVVTIKKPNTGTWKQLGAPLEDNNKIMDSQATGTDDYVTGVIVEKETVAQDVILIGLQVTSSSFIGVPVGFHVRLRLVGRDVPPKKYTPVIKNMVEDEIPGFPRVPRNSTEESNRGATGSSPNNSAGQRTSKDAATSTTGIPGRKSLGTPAVPPGTTTGSTGVPENNGGVTGTPPVPENLPGESTTTSGATEVPRKSIGTPAVAGSSAAENSKGASRNSVAEKNGKILYFIIKIYPDGQLTREIGLLQINSQLQVGYVAGRYDPEFFTPCDTLALVAGGTGITPYFRIADFLRKRSETYPISRIFLVFFNHSERDIIWGDQWTKLAEKWSKFRYFPVLSKPTENWKGLTGRVDNANLFESILLRVLGKDPALVGQQKINSSELGKFKAMTCGSYGFNDAFVTMLKSQTIVTVPAPASIEDDVFVF